MLDLKPLHVVACFLVLGRYTIPLLFSRELNDVPYNVNVIDLHGCTAIRASDVIVGISGHGFLIASDSLTRHPLGPGIQPEENISDI